MINEGAKKTLLFRLVFLNMDNKSKGMDKSSKKGCYFCKVAPENVLWSENLIKTNS